MISQRAQFVKLLVQILIYRDVRTNQSIKSFAELFQKATEGTGRVALYSAFLLIAFLCAYAVKEKRLNLFAIKIC